MESSWSSPFETCPRLLRDTPEADILRTRKKDVHGIQSDRSLAFVFARQKQSHNQQVENCRNTQAACARLANVRNLRDNNNLPSMSGLLIRKGFSATVLMIRLARIGARKQPYYRVVVIDKERARNGRSVEVVGLYNPRTNPTTIDLKHDRIDYWVSKGAQLSDTVGRLLTKAKAAPAPAA
jgi:small subunit ribosomal protein S16